MVSEGRNYASTATTNADIYNALLETFTTISTEYIAEKRL